MENYLLQFQPVPQEDKENNPETATTTTTATPNATPFHDTTNGTKKPNNIPSTTASNGSNIPNGTPTITINGNTSLPVPSPQKIASHNLYLSPLRRNIAPGNSTSILTNSVLPNKFLYSFGESPAKVRK